MDVIYAAIDPRKRKRDETWRYVEACGGASCPTERSQWKLLGTGAPAWLRSQTFSQPWIPLGTAFAQGPVTEFEYV